MFTPRNNTQNSDNRNIAFDTIERVGNSLSKSFEDTKASISNKLSDFSSKSIIPAANQDFLNSNSLVAKFAFFIIVLIIFIILCNLGISFIGYLLQTPSSPYIVKGLINGSNPVVITQDPSLLTSVNIKRSNNRKTGIEFTWSVWILVSSNDMSSTANKITYRNIFNKGDSSYDNTSSGNGQSRISNGPGLYLSSLNKNENVLRVVMDSVNSNVGPSVIEVKGIPFNKWCHVVIRLENKVLDVYVNGTLTSRIIMIDVAKQNYDDINVCQNGGFNGQLSNLRYFDYALKASEINGIVQKGPDLKTSSLASSNIVSSPYFLSSLWFSKQ
jgi:hypothetical protein